MKFKKYLLATTALISVASQPQPSLAQPPTLTYSVGKYQAQAPDWAKITWGTLPPVQESGYLSIPKNLIPQFGYDPSRSWSAGQQVDSIVMLGDVEDAFRLDSFTLNQISAITPANSAKLTLKDFGLMEWQTPQSLVKAIPSLGNLNVNQVQPIRDLFIKAGVSGGGKIGQIINYNPKAANLTLGNLDLSKYSLNSIPRLNITQINKFSGWQRSFINQVPNLDQVPFDKMPLPIQSGTGVVGVASVVLGKAERGDAKVGANYFVSGSVNSRSATIPVACEAGKECAYMELGDLAGQGGSLYGKRWASGSSQQVKGGFGFLSVVNGGKEPTGRLVYGPGFKVALIGVNESKGTADFGLFFRICVRPPLGPRTCTPYFIGPIPWIPVSENNLVILGAGG
ncbi:hypothetical protein [Nostoc sp. CCY0012]|uniref:hypothetical protein n=1 Tax=Nostoc sp. CCY0012 TaxID=1056123 RepID=UPI0039C5C405